MNLTHEEIELLNRASAEKIFEDYSGRGMFGATTQAVVVESRATLISNLSDILEERIEVKWEAGCKEVNSLIAKIAKAREDSFGKYDVVIY